MDSSGFVCDHFDGFYYKYHKASLRRGGSWIDSFEWIKSEKTTISPQDNDGNCFHFVVIVALNHESIGKHPERTAFIKISPFMNKYVRLAKINFPSEAKDWKNFAKIKISIALNVLFLPNN